MGTASVAKQQAVSHFLLRRRSGWYFRYRIPTAMRSILGRTEIRLYLGTIQRAAARERVSLALPYVIALKRLSKRMHELSEQDRQRAVTHAYRCICEQIDHTRSPWERSAPGTLDASPGLNEARLLQLALGFKPQNGLPDRLFANGTQVMIAAVQHGDGRGGEALASHVLDTLGLSLEPESAGFQALSVEMLKLMVTVRTIVDARSRGDYSTEGDLLNGWRAVPADGLIAKPAAISSGPTLSEAWREYFTEKTAAHPRPAWRGKTARGQSAMFAELLEIVGDLPVAEMTRNHMLKYRDVVSRLPSNRQKRYPGKSANELLALETPASQMPSGRTVMEKIIQIAAFWGWCRTTKGYLQTDPTAGVKIDLASQSYSVFTKSDVSVRSRHPRLGADRRG